MKIFKNTSVFIRWFFSYLMILALALLVSVGMYFFSYDVINRQGEKMNQVILEKVQTEMDGYFDKAKSTAVSLMLDASVSKAGRVKGSFNVKDRVLLYGIYQDINNLHVASSRFSHVYIYFLNTNTVLSEQGHLDSDLFYELYYKNEIQDIDAFREIMKQRWTGKVMVMQAKEGSELVFLRSDYPRGDSRWNMTFAVTISQDKLLEWMKELSWDEDTGLLILGEEGVLFSTTPVANDLFVDGWDGLEKIRSTETLQVDGKEYRLTMIPSKDNGLYYATMMPMEHIRQGAREIQMYMLAGLCLCITLGVAMAFILTRNHYRPLRHMMSNFGEYTWKKGAEDEYKWMQNRVMQFMEEHELAQKRNLDNEKILYNQYLYRLITLPYQESLREGLDLSKRTQFDKEGNMVGLIYLQQAENSQWQAEVDRELFRFIIANVVNETLEGVCSVEVVDNVDSFACIINGDVETLNNKEKVENAVTQMQEFMNVYMQLHVSVVFGAAREGIEGIHQSYLTARETAEYRGQLAQQQIVWYEDVKNSHELYQYSMDEEQRILNAIKAGQKESACQWMNAVIEENYQAGGLTLVMKQCLLSELLGTLIKGADQTGSIECLKKLMEEYGAPNAFNEQAAKAYFREMAERLCEDINENEAAKRENSQFGRQVMEYVRQNFHDPDLNISITALHFKITPSYLSALFREQTGENLLEFINRTRVERAKELLEEGKTLSEICQLTGFRSSGALIRVFKKTTGITPGQMKRQID